MNIVARLLREMRCVRRILPSPWFRRWSWAFCRSAGAVVRTRSLGVVDDRFGPDFSVRTSARELEIRGGSLGVFREIFGHECYIPAGELADARLVLDLGANCGAFSLFALVHAPTARLVSVEAQPELMPVLKRNVAANGFGGRFEAQNALVGGATNAWSKELCRRHPALPVWDFAASVRDGAEIDFLKCDVEGAEFPLLRDRPSWLCRVKRLALEYHGAWADGAGLADVLRDAGFEVQQAPHGRLGYLFGKRRDA